MLVELVELCMSNLVLILSLVLKLQLCHAIIMIISLVKFFCWSKNLTKFEIFLFLSVELEIPNLVLILCLVCKFKSGNMTLIATPLISLFCMTIFSKLYYLIRCFIKWIWAAIFLFIRSSWSVKCGRHWEWKIVHVQGKYFKKILSGNCSQLNLVH